jgi:16S rRNA (cytosine967-C5)-methyltransferase
MTVDDAFPPVDDRDALWHLPPPVLVKAAGPGRMRGIALEAWAAARAEPRRAGRLLREGVKEARALHSRERRLVREALYGMVRGQVRWSHLLGTDDPTILWVAQLVEHGLPVADARGLVEAPYERLLDPEVHLAGLDAEARLAVVHGLPLAVVRSIVAGWGLEQTRALLSASDARAPVTLRANLAVVRDRATAAERLAAEGIETVPGRRVSTALHVVGRANLPTSRAFRDGVVEVQDEGSQAMAALVPDVAKVWDVCAGAGGKALALAARGLEVLATDVRVGALAEARRRAERARVRLRTERLGPDGAIPEAVGRFAPDAVLVDAPCSGTGVLRRHPEHRWLLDPDALQALPRLQGAILDRAAAHVPVGGHLVYGTCSVLTEENEGVVDAFVARNPGFEVVGAPLRLAPHQGGTDGFFAQVLSRSHPLQST